MASITRRRKDLQKLLRDIRREAELKQEEIASQLGKPQSYVSKYESGERKLELPEIEAICRATGISLAQFIKRYERSQHD